MKRYLGKNFGYGELDRVYQKPLTFQPNLNCLFHKNFQYVKLGCLKPTRFNGGFKIYLPDHPVPQ